MAACRGNERSTARYRSTPASSQMMAFSGNLEDSPDWLVPGQSLSVANPAHSTGKRAGMSRYPCSAVMPAIMLGLARCRSVLKGRNAGSRMRPWIATIAACALALQVLLTGVAAGHFMAAGDASASSPIRHLPRQCFVGRSGPAGQRAACSITVHALHAGKSAVRDLAERPRHRGQRCNGHVERCCSNRRPRSRVQFAHGPVSAWPTDEHLHFRLIRSIAGLIG